MAETSSNSSRFFKAQSSTSFSAWSRSSESSISLVFSGWCLSEIGGEAVSSIKHMNLNLLRTKIIGFPKGLSTTKISRSTSCWKKGTSFRIKLPIHPIWTNWYHQTGDINISTFQLEINCTNRKPIGEKKVVNKLHTLAYHRVVEQAHRFHEQ